MSTQQEVSYDPMNPYPWYRYMRKAYPVRYSEQVKMWYVFRYEDVQRILADVQTFSSGGVQGESYIEASFGRMDPPRHGQYRTLVSQAFTPRSVALLEPRITAIVNGLLDAVAHTGRIELISELAFPLPAMIIMELFGVPAESREYFGKLSASFIQDVETDPSRMPLVETQLVELLAPLIEVRRSQPTDDLISRLLAAEAEGQKLSTRDILATCIVMLIAGHETTARLIGNAMYCFTERPEVMAELQADPVLIPAALEEVLRYRSPVSGIMRTATSNVRIGTTSIKAGQAIRGADLLGKPRRDGICRSGGLRHPANAQSPFRPRAGNSLLHRSFAGTAGEQDRDPVPVATLPRSAADRRGASTAEHGAGRPAPGNEALSDRFHR